MVLETGWSGHFTLPCRSHNICDTDFLRQGKGGARQCPGPGRRIWNHGSWDAPLSLALAPRPQLHLMVCSCFNVWPRAKLMWQHQQKEENSKDIKDRARLIYISLNFPSPLQEEKARNIKECNGRERVEKEKHLGYSFESIKGFLKVRLNVLNSPVSGSSASSLLPWAPSSYEDRRTGLKQGCSDTEEGPRSLQNISKCVERWKILSTTVFLENCTDCCFSSFFLSTEWFSACLIAGFLTLRFEQFFFCHMRILMHHRNQVQVKCFFLEVNKRNKWLLA